MTVLLALCGLASATPDGRYALRGTVTVPDGGSVRIDLGPEWVARCPDPTTYLLVDPAGREVPYAGRTSDAFPPERERLTWEPVEVSPSRWTYLVHPPESRAPVQALSVRGVPEGWVVRAVVSRQGRVVTRALVWNLPTTGAGIRDEIPLPPGETGPWQVDLRTVSFWRWRPWAEFEAVTEQVGQVAPVRWPIAVEPPVAVTVSESRLTVPLPRGGLLVRGVRLVAADPVFSRPVVVRDGAGRVLGERRLERFVLGEEAIDVDRIPIFATPSRSLVLDLTDDRSVPLQVERAEVELRGLALLVPVATAGRWTVFGCGPAGEGYDLERLSDRLASATTPRVRPSPPEPNAGWTAALVTDGVAGPGGPIRSALRPIGRIEGPPGLVRVGLPPEVLAAASTDLGDLRITTPDGNQLPYLTADAGGVPVHGLVWTETQEGPVTVVAIDLPLAGLPLEQLVLHAVRGRFLRTVEIRGGGRPIRVDWQGTGDEVARLVVPLDGWDPARIEVRIDNGANAPLPLLPPVVSMGTGDAWLVLPPEGAVMSVGTASVRPRYDLELVRSEVIDGPSLPASVVPVPQAPAVEVAVVAPGVKPKPTPYPWATAAIGLCVLVIAALTARRVREDPPSP